MTLMSTFVVEGVLSQVEVDDVEASIWAHHGGRCYDSCAIRPADPGRRLPGLTAVVRSHGVDRVARRREPVETDLGRLEPRYVESAWLARVRREANLEGKLLP